jgi:iron complex outermembrane recepter protein
MPNPIRKSALSIRTEIIHPDSCGSRHSSGWIPARRMARAIMRTGLAVVVAAACGDLAAQETGTISGQVTNEVTESPLSRARVTVIGTGLETFTDSSGWYRLRGVTPGATNVNVTYLGFTSRTDTVTVKSSEESRLDFAIVREGLTLRRERDEEGEVHELEAFEVVAETEMSAQALALTEQRFAPNIKGVVAMDSLVDRGDENIGEYLRYLPGVTVLEESGTAASISLRGFDASMTNVTLDGAEVASSEGGATRTVTLREVPMINVERLEVTKVPTPDMPASGLGGSVNLITRSSLGRKSPLLRYSVSYLFNSLEGVNLGGGPTKPLPGLNVKMKRPSFSLSYLYPSGPDLAFSFGYSSTWRQYPYDGPLQTAMWFLDTDQPFQLQSRWELFGEIRASDAVQAGMEWKISRSNLLTFGFQYKESERYRSNNRIDVNFNTGATGDATFTQADPAGNATIRQGAASNLAWETVAKQLNLKFEHFGRDWKLTLQGSYATSTTHIGSLDRGHFAYTNSSIIQLVMRGEDIGADGGIIPTTYSAVDRAGNPVDIYDGANYYINSVRVDEYDYTTDRMSARLDLNKDFGSRFSIRAGTMVDFMEKDTVRNIPTYNFRPNGQSSLAARTAGNFDVIDDDFRLDFMGQPVRWISEKKVYDLYLQHPEWFVENEGSTVTNRVNNSKLLREMISSGYLRTDIRLLPGNALWMVFGVRFEHTAVEGWGRKDDPSAQFQKNEDGNFILRGGQRVPITLDPGERARLRYTERGAYTEKSYQDFFPSMNVSYAFTDSLVLRLAFAKTIGRPNIDFIVPGYQLPDPDAITGDDAAKIRVNNTGLEPWTAKSYDISLESYLFKNGFGSVGLFRKEITNFFARVEERATEEMLSSFGFPEQDILEYLNFPILTLVNGGEAVLTGVEVGYQQSLAFLPDWARGLQVFGNLTHMKLSGSNAEDFSNFNPTSVNWGVNLIRSKFYIKLTCSYQEETRQAPTPANASIGIPEETYRYQGLKRKYSLSMQYSFSKSLSLYASIWDIGGFEIMNYRYAPDTVDYAKPFQYRKMGSNISIGIRGTF